MPKPYFFARPSGLYVRFLVPADLRSAIGSRFLVRSLGGRRGDHARLVAAAHAVALSQAFDAMRQGAGMTDIKKLLESAQAAADGGTTRDWTATGVRIGGIDFGTVSTTGRKDTLDFIETLKAAAALPAAQQGARVAAAIEPVGPADSPFLSTEIANHISDLERRSLSPDTITESKHTLRILLGVIGDMPVGQVKAPHIRLFWDGVRRWPANATVKPAYRDLSVRQIIERGRAEQVPRPSAHTMNKHRQRLGVFFTGLVDADIIARSPLRGMGPEIDTSTEMETGRPFTPAELAQIFDPVRFTAWASKSPHRWWGPMLGLYTGARVNEVAQLYIEDVRQVNGVWGLFFWKNARNQKIKTKSSIRFVPLAKPLLDAGFLEFVEDMRATGHPRLFPHLPAGTRKDGTPNGLGYGRQLSRQFSAYLRGFGIEKGVGFHAFRHTLSTELTEAGVDVTVIAKITGHAQTQKVPVLETHYIHIADAKTLPDRVEALSKFRPHFDLPIHVRNHFAESMLCRERLHS